jgi:hypothetical protein
MFEFINLKRETFRKHLTSRKIIEWLIWGLASLYEESEKWIIRWNMWGSLFKSFENRDSIDFDIIA